MKPEDHLVVPTAAGPVEHNHGGEPERYLTTTEDIRVCGLAVPRAIAAARAELGLTSEVQVVGYPLRGFVHVFRQSFDEAGNLTEHKPLRSYLIRVTGVELLSTEHSSDARVAFNLG